MISLGLRKWQALPTVMGSKYASSVPFAVLSAFLFAATESQPTEPQSRLTGTP